MSRGSWNFGNENKFQEQVQVLYNFERLQDKWKYERKWDKLKNQQKVENFFEFWKFWPSGQSEEFEYWYDGINFVNLNVLRVL